MLFTSEFTINKYISFKFFIHEHDLDGHRMIPTFLIRSYQAYLLFKCKCGCPDGILEKDYKAIHGYIKHTDHINDVGRPTKIFATTPTIYNK